MDYSLLLAIEKQSKDISVPGKSLNWRERGQIGSNGGSPISSNTRHEKQISRESAF